MLNFWRRLFSGWRDAETTKREDKPQAFAEDKNDLVSEQPTANDARYTAATAADIYRAEHPEEFAAECKMDETNAEVTYLLTEADKLTDDGDYESALAYYGQAADLGSVNAMFRIGALYYRGLNPARQKDTQTALAWFHKAAEQGYFYAMYYIGCMYRLGDGVYQDSAAAVEWFIRAIAHNEKNPLLTSEAMMALGEMFCAGEGVEQNKKIGMSWYLAAGEAGQTMAAEFVARAYETGEGLPQNKREAARWKGKIPAAS